MDGSPRDAVKQFRDILEERRLDDLAGRDHDPDAVRSEDVQEPVLFDVTGPTAIVVDPGAEGELMAGGELRVEFDFHSAVELEGLMLAIGIDNTKGQVAYSTTTRLLDQPIDPFIGSRRAEFSMPDARFGPGKYFVNISVIDHTGVHLYDWPQSCSFDVHDYVISFGMVHMTPGFSIPPGSTNVLSRRITSYSSSPN